MFGFNRKRERKSQRTDERKHAKTAKPSRKECDDDNGVFQESTEKLQAQGHRLTNALEVMEKNNPTVADHGPIHDHFLAGHAIEESGVTLLSFTSKQHMTTPLAQT